MNTKAKRIYKNVTAIRVITLSPALPSANNTGPRPKKVISTNAAARITYKKGLNLFKLVILLF